MPSLKSAGLYKEPKLPLSRQSRSRASLRCIRSGLYGLYKQPYGSIRSSTKLPSTDQRLQAPKPVQDAACSSAYRLEQGPERQTWPAPPPSANMSSLRRLRSFASICASSRRGVLLLGMHSLPSFLLLDVVYLGMKMILNRDCTIDNSSRAHILR